MPRYRKKPVVIEAMQIQSPEANGASISDVLQWILSNGGNAYSLRSTIRIRTLEGEMAALPGDYVIRGLKGEFYPCKSDIFEQSYDLVEDQQQTG